MASITSHDIPADKAQGAVMWAVTFAEYGEPGEVLTESEVPVPEPGASEVLVRVQAVDINPADWELCRGFLPGNLPRGIGLDVSGTVEAVGADVTDVAVGDVVFGTPEFVTRHSAGVATYAVLNLWFPVPKGLDLVTAAALIMPLRTAHGTLDSMGVTKGTRLLVHGGGSTIGHAAVQVAQRRGAQVTATAGPTHTAALEGFGAQVTAYGDGMVERVRTLAPEGFDMVLDASPKNEATLAQLVTLVNDPSIITTVSNHGQVEQFGVKSNLVPTGRPIAPEADYVPEFARLAAAGKFSVPVAATYPMKQWRDAMELSVGGKARGKVVLES